MLYEVKYHWQKALYNGSLRFFPHTVSSGFVMKTVLTPFGLDTIKCFAVVTVKGFIFISEGQTFIFPFNFDDCRLLLTVCHLCRKWVLLWRVLRPPGQPTSTAHSQRPCRLSPVT